MYTAHFNFNHLTRTHWMFFAPQNSRLKLKILNHFTKLFLADTKSSNRLKGYVATETDLIPIETRGKAAAHNASHADELWQAIGATSEHQDKWHELFFGNGPSDVNENSTF